MRPIGVSCAGSARVLHVVGYARADLREAQRKGMAGEIVALLDAAEKKARGR